MEYVRNMWVKGRSTRKKENEFQFSLELGSTTSIVAFNKALKQITLKNVTQDINTAKCLFEYKGNT